MDLLVAEPLEAEVLDWLDARHEVFYAPRITEDARVFIDAMARTRTVLLPPRVAVDRRLLARAPRLQGIGRIVGGLENIDLQACARAQVHILRCLDAAAPAEAEFMLGALMALLRPDPRERERFAGRELGHSTVGLLGMTASGRHLGRLLPTLGTRVIGYDPAIHASDPSWQRWGVAPRSLRELFEQSDAVCVQMDCYARHTGLLGERVLGWSKPGQVLVSVAPIDLFDAAALAEALRSHRLTAAWFDHAGPEVRSAGHPLHGVRGLVTTPRLAAYTREARLRSAWGVARRINHLLRQPAPRAPAAPVTLRDRIDQLERSVMPPVAAAATAASPASR
jgi:D-3-phosphoglycerate dehydrogenase